MKVCKKIISLLLITLIAALCLCGCKTDNNTAVKIYSLENGKETLVAEISFDNLDDLGEIQNMINELTLAEPFSDGSNDRFDYLIEHFTAVSSSSNKLKVGFDEEKVYGYSENYEDRTIGCSYANSITKSILISIIENNPVQ